MVSPGRMTARGFLLVHLSSDARYRLWPASLERRDKDIMVRTGYYSKLDVYRKMGYELVSISRSEPAGVVVDRKIWDLAPSRETLNRIKYCGGTEEQYTHEYLGQLDALGYERIVRLIADTGRKVVLLCWERNGAFCHRHLLAAWLNARIGRELVCECEVD